MTFCILLYGNQNDFITCYRAMICLLRIRLTSDYIRLGFGPFPIKTTTFSVERPQQALVLCYGNEFFTLKKNIGFPCYLYSFKQVE